MSTKRFSKLDPNTQQGRGCGTRPNCVCSLVERDNSHFIEPLSVNDDDPILSLIKCVTAMPGAKLVDHDQQYGHVEFRSSLFKFVDDVEFIVADGNAQTIHVRSASRTGYGDHDVNRNRVEQIRQMISGQIPEHLRKSHVAGSSKQPGIEIRLLSRIFRPINKSIPWHRLPWPIGILNLLAFRDELRHDNLYDLNEAEQEGEAKQMPPRWLRARSNDGSFNDLSEPSMGQAGMRFGRNCAIAYSQRETDELMMDPNPREISRRLLARDEFKPVPFLNMHAAAWIQFQVHGWMNHDRVQDKHIEVPLADDDDWSERPMRVKQLERDGVHDCGVALYRNTESHWWDGSQIYGASLELQQKLRTGTDGKIHVDANGLLLPDPTPHLQDTEGKGGGVDLTGFSDNYWLGLAMLHTIFTREHNAICDHLKANAPGPWDDERLFDVARLINTALMAKVHTVEWTPAILQHPALKVAMNGNWHGILGEAFRRKFGRLGSGEILSGILGSTTEHHAVPYGLTEEFVSVYRLHPLIPDEVVLWSQENNAEHETLSFTDIQGIATRRLTTRYPMKDLLYSFGRSNPGQIRLKNFPNTLRNLQRLTGETIDLAVVDIVRDRQRGVPRYNDFRESLHMPRFTTFDELTDDPELAKEIADVYGDDINKVDTLVGLLAEPLPKGFGFSDTAFRIFILMASRRLKSDRFFTTDYRPEVYTQAGLEWIDDNDMSTICLRHYPELAPNLVGVENFFFPWNATS